jgi:hypothetical protein
MSILRILALTAALCLPLAARAQVAIGNGSVTLTGTTVRQIFTDATGAQAGVNPRRFWRVCNINILGGPTAWLSRYNTTPAPNAAGSYALAPQRCEEFQAPGFVPQYPLYAVADGTGSVALTAEVN